MAEAIAELERGREAYAGGAWRDAYTLLSSALEEVQLAAADLELLATSAYMLGREDDYARVLERAYQAYLDGGETSPAVRCAFWIGVSLMLRGETARGTGWFGRGRRLLDRDGSDCVERGYLLIPLLLAEVARGDWEAAGATAAEAAAIAERFGDADLLAMAVHEQGHVLARQGRVGEGLRLLDEAMVAVTAGELSPIVTGLVYCSVIAYCQELHELRRAREWTGALARWCERRPQMVAHTGLCLVHRAELMELGGAWPDALAEARRAAERLAQVRSSELAAGHALYLQGEIHRLRGQFGAAEQAYREASRRGREPQPGLALLRLAERKFAAAEAAIRRVEGETSESGDRAALLPAYVEIMLAVGDIDAARAASRELQVLAQGREEGLPGAMAAQARGAVELAAGDAYAALSALRRAGRLWQQLDIPYEAARARVLVGLACRVLDDEETAALELDAARGVFAQLRAGPDLARLASLTGVPGRGDAGALTRREVEVLRRLAAGATNKAIAAELFLSVRTVDRHVSNIFVKLGVSSRAAATAYALEHELL